jgi:hypothetical protein
VIKTGNGDYKLKPVINVTSETYSEGEDLPEGSGSVSGTVSYYGYDNDNSELILVGIGDASVSLSGGVYIFAIQPQLQKKKVQKVNLIYIMFL